LGQMAGHGNKAIRGNANERNVENRQALPLAERSRRRLRSLIACRDRIGGNALARGVDAAQDYEGKKAGEENAIPRLLAASAHRLSVPAAKTCRGGPRHCLQNHISPKTRGKAPRCKIVVWDQLPTIPLPIPFILTRNGVWCSIQANVFARDCRTFTLPCLQSRAERCFRECIVSVFLYSPPCFTHILRAFADTYFQLPCSPLETEEGLVWPARPGCPEAPGLSGLWFYRPGAARSVAEQDTGFDRTEGVMALEKTRKIARKRATLETL